MNIIKHGTILRSLSENILIVEWTSFNNALPGKSWLSRKWSYFVVKECSQNDSKIFAIESQVSEWRFSKVSEEMSESEWIFALLTSFEDSSLTTLKLLDSNIS